MALLGSVHFWCYNESFYKKQHDTLTLYGKPIAEYIGISEEDLVELTHFTLSYLNDPKANLDIQMEVKGEMREIFTDDEKAHMVDVRNLNLAANYILIASSIIFVVFMILYIKNKSSFTILYRQYLNILKYVMVFVGFLGLWIIIDFDSFWTFFHHIFFSGNDLWLLDLRKDILIMIVPPQFFNNLVIRITVSFIALLILFYLLLKYLSKNKESIAND